MHMCTVSILHKVHLSEDISFCLSKKSPIVNNENNLVVALKTRGY